MGPRARARGNDPVWQGGHGSGWLQWGRERALAEICRLRPIAGAQRGFNGAASARSRKWNATSMPQFTKIQLQWGRERALAEMSPPAKSARLSAASMGPRARALGNPQGYPPPCGRYPASMGPRARARGNGAGRRAALEGQGASMGPRARARGNPTGNVAAATGRGLQWGRERALAEIAPCPSAATSASWLQWGRERALAEMWRLSRGRMPWVGFNGAASARSRKCARRTDPHRHGAASMGPRARARGNKRAAITVAESVPASMGPRARARGNLLRCPIG